MTRACQLGDWLQQRRDACELVVKPIPWQASKAWRFEQGRLQHMTGGFFSVIGIRATANIRALDGLVRPIIDQPEVGILGFMVRRAGAANEWLIQAKAEPGNVGEVQLAPSVQATRSNYTRLHGGAATHYLEFFTGSEAGATIVADSLQSEQGNRFLAKYNRNMTVLVDDRSPDPCSADWRWAPAADVRAMLVRDFGVNTDARSVLVCSDWRLLADGEAFARWHGKAGWGAALLASFEAGLRQTDAEVLQWLAVRRDTTRVGLETVALESMPGWRLTDESINCLQDGRPLIRIHDIQVNSREVEHWDQPFVLSHREETVVQLCQRRDGVLGFLLRASVEVGFSERVQLGPTWQSDDVTAGNGVADRIEAAFRYAQQRCSTLQSDEGGRFYRSVCHYRILELDGTAELDVDAHGYLWLSLGQIYRLVRSQGVFTNEARSVLSMLLAEL
jgi:dTDP-4-dehydro-6-deoxy-alpha-D-glucopyranose 2,3-dehydratase